MKGPWIGFFWVPNASLGPVFPVGAAVRRKRGPRAAPVNRRFRPRRGRGGADASVVSCCQHFCYDADAGQPGRASLRLSWGSWEATGGWGYQGRDPRDVTRGGHGITKAVAWRLDAERSAEEVSDLWPRGEYNHQLSRLRGKDPSAHQVQHPRPLTFLAPTP